MADLIDDHKATARGQPEQPAAGFPPALETFQSPGLYASDVWRFVDFGQVFTYLRGNMNLRIPDEWRPVVPSEL